MNLKQLEAFVCVADRKSFSRAAKELFLTQPTISAHIASLEKELDVRLFIRNTKEVNLSEDGKTLYKYARQMIDLEEQIEACFVGEKQQEGRKISIAASTIPAQYILPRILSKFNEKYPREQFKVVESDSAKVVELVAGGAADVGFTGTVLEKKFCKYIPFYKDELIIIMPNTEKYEKRVNEQNLNWITEEAFIMREEGSGTRKEAEKQLKKAGIDTEQLNIVASMGNQEAIKRSVISGMGITIISKLAAEEEIRTGKVLWCPMPDKSDGRDLNIVYNKNFHLSKSAERFIRVTKEMYGIDKK
ncbi:selenium metabolism-associated LysR family transcriptional regulator [Sellimonas sp.]|uniref:selenium metabolism-associated LysR family transcriptional regulator n=1 Tax=Sellimonas sp. TaxID=2021466 RepID=UPI000B382D09|nr:selenium metabolism-associated LysR family transcriptional regulator [Sellimonas sp.]OUP01389.1 LysR family transcriptional regulator [Drancourtella sp. An210]OUP66860.1 LysR family transcriptional regulator [Drancourtella sp. An177]